MKTSINKFLIISILPFFIFTGCVLNSNLLTEIEPNNNFNDANNIRTNGEIYAGSFDSTSDFDIYTFYGMNGFVYHVNVNWASGEDLDLVGDWYAYDYNNFYHLDFTQKKGNEYDPIYFDGVEGGCYLVIYDFNHSIGSYTISVKKDPI